MDGYNQARTFRGGSIYDISLSRIFTIIIENWDDNNGGGISKWVGQYHHLELHLKGRKEMKVRKFLE
jgi:hypothetical protein